MPPHGAFRRRWDDSRHCVLRASPVSGRGDGRSGVVSAKDSRGAASDSRPAGEDGRGDVPADPDEARTVVRTGVCR